MAIPGRPPASPSTWRRNRDRRCLDRHRYSKLDRAIRGTNFNDTYVATGFNGASDDLPMGTTFNEFEGMDGNDTITGNGDTRISYSNASAAVTVDLVNGTAHGTATGDAAKSARIRSWGASPASSARTSTTRSPATATTTSSRALAATTRSMAAAATTRSATRARQAR